MHINDLLKSASERGASDLHVKVGSYPIIRVDGELVAMTEHKRLMQEDTIALAFSIMSARQKQKFKEHMEIDMAYSVPGLGRSNRAVAPRYSPLRSSFHSLEDCFQRLAALPASSPLPRCRATSRCPSPPPRWWSPARSSSPPRPAA